MRGGGQRPFGTFPKFHPFWRRRPSLSQGPQLPGMSRSKWVGEPDYIKSYFRTKVVLLVQYVYFIVLLGGIFQFRYWYFFWYQILLVLYCFSAPLNLFKKCHISRDIPHKVSWCRRIQWSRLFLWHKSGDWLWNANLADNSMAPFINGIFQTSITKPSCQHATVPKHHPAIWYHCPCANWRGIQLQI